MLVGRLHVWADERLDLIKEAIGNGGGKPLEDTQQLVSLWSPVLKDEDRDTIVFYGFGQLDKSKVRQVTDTCRG